MTSTATPSTLSRPAARAAAPAGAAIEFRGVQKSYGATSVLGGPVAAHRGGRVHRPARPVRLRQDHRAPDPGRLRDPSGGDVLADGEPVLPPPHRRGIGMVFQSYSLFPEPHRPEERRVRTALRCVPRAERKRIALEMLETVRLGGFENAIRTSSRAGSSSVWRSRDTAISPGILLPTSRFRHSTRRCAPACAEEIRELQLRTDHGRVRDPRPEEALAMADRVAVMETADPADRHPGRAVLPPGGRVCRGLRRRDKRAAGRRALAATGVLGTARRRRGRGPPLRAARRPRVRTSTDAVGTVTSHLFLGPRRASPSKPSTARTG